MVRRRVPPPARAPPRAVRSRPASDNAPWSAARRSAPSLAQKARARVRRAIPIKLPPRRTGRPPRRRWRCSRGRPSCCATPRRCSRGAPPPRASRHPRAPRRILFLTHGAARAAPPAVLAARNAVHTRRGTPPARRGCAAPHCARECAPRAPASAFSDCGARCLRHHYAREAARGRAGALFQVPQGRSRGIPPAPAPVLGP